MPTMIWVGIKESDLDDVEIPFKYSVTFFGSGKGNNTAYSEEVGKRINHNLSNKDASEFLSRHIHNICNQFPDAQFMYFGQYHASTSPPHIKKRCCCYNDHGLLELLRDKISARFWLAASVPIVPSVLLSGAQCNFSHIKEMLPDHGQQFVAQRNYSAGGCSTFLLTEDQTKSFAPQEILMVSPYLEYSIPLNVTAVIFDEEILLFPPSIQIISEDHSRLIYKGADFISYRKLSSTLQEKVQKYAKIVCQNLKNVGYRGVCGIDFIADVNEVYLMEVNERFQASTYLINIALKQSFGTSVQELSFEAFQHKHNQIDLSEFTVDYSHYIYTYHKEYDSFYPQQYCRARKDPDVFRIVSDGYEGTTGIYEEDAYLFALVFSTNITSINHDYKINLLDNVREHAPLSPDDLLHVKFGLMNQGFQIADSAQDYFSRHEKPTMAINSGMDLIIYENIRVCSAFNQPHHKPLSPFMLENLPAEGLFLTYDGMPISPVKYDTKDPLLGRKTLTGVPFGKIAFLANRRLQINHESVCFYKKNKISCKFCALPDSGEPFEIQDVFEVIDAYLEDCSFDNFLIGGASNIFTKGWDTILTISEYISSHTDKDIYLMTTPPSNPAVLGELKSAGITQVSFNIEIFDRTIARDIMPGKGVIPLQVYLSALKNAVKLWGRTGNVRSMIMVGLEPISSLLKGIEMLAQMGVQPILSPFGPRAKTDLEQFIPLTTDTLIWIYKKTVEICKPYGLFPGPDSINGQNNTLSLPASYIQNNILL